VLGQTQAQAEEAKTQVTHILNQLGLQLSAEKTRITTYGEGYSLLGFVRSSRSKLMRPKSQDQFKDKVREVTVRKRHLDAQLIEELNRVIRGTAHYFATRWSTNRWLFQKLDSWIRRRLRCMKFKRFSYHHNPRMRRKQLAKLGRLSLESFCRSGERPRPSPVKERRTDSPPGGSLCPKSELAAGKSSPAGVARS
jgi:hypothetical protein